MTVLHSLDRTERGPAVVTIGTFDGVHRGHQRLLQTTKQRAHELHAVPVAITFEPIPAMVLRPDRFPGRICSPGEKLALIDEIGIETVVVLAFDRALSLLAPEAFMEQVASAFDVREMWVGEAFALGKDRVGNVERLREIGTELGFTVEAMPRVVEDGGVISSSDIRAAVIRGDVRTAARLLGRWFHVDGIVVHGAHFGRTIGYPTANLEPPADQVALADGIYASLCTLSDRSAPLWGMTYVGTRPTVNSGARQIETNILDFAGDLYGQRIRIDLVERLRPDAEFATLDELVTQLGHDEAETRRVLTGVHV